MASCAEGGADPDEVGELLGVTSSGASASAALSRGPGELSSARQGPAADVDAS